MERSGRHRVSRFFHSREDKDVILAWKSDLNRILHIFNVCPARSHPISSSLIPLCPDRAGCKHPHCRCRYTPGRVENSPGG